MDASSDKTTESHPDGDGSAGTLNSTAYKIADQQKGVGAKRIDSVAGALHGAAKELEGEMPLAASLAHEAARQLENTAATLRERGVDDMLNTFTTMARRQPLAVFGGAALIGLAVSRFLKSSSESSRQHRPM